jgi:hypothetical protein
VTALLSNPTAPALGEAGRFVILASQAITGGAGSVITNGDMGIMDEAQSYYAGFTFNGTAGSVQQLVGGLAYAHDDIDPALIPSPYASTIAFIDQLRTDLNNAYNFLAAGTNPTAAIQACPTQLGGQTLTRGVYEVASDVSLTTGPLYLNAQGDPNSIFIISIAGNLDIGAPSGAVILEGLAQAKNVYWRVAGVTTIEAGRSVYGNVFSWQQINVDANAAITGTLFSVNEQVTLISDTVTGVAAVAARTAAEITAYSIAGQMGLASINSGAGTIAVTVPHGTPVTALIATFTTSPGTTIKVGTTRQVTASTPNNFTSPVIYVVTAQNGTTTKNWTVTVTIAP